METANGGLRSDGLAMIYGLMVDTEWNGVICYTLYLADPKELDPGQWEKGDWLCDHEDWESPMVFSDRNLMPINPEADPLESMEPRECQA